MTLGVRPALARVAGDDQLDGVACVDLEVGTGALGREECPAGGGDLAERCVRRAASDRFAGEDCMQTELESAEKVCAHDS